MVNLIIGDKMICNLYLTKVLETKHKLITTLTRAGMVTTIEFVDIGEIATVIGVKPGENNIQLAIESYQWEAISNLVNKFNQEKV